jgi:predicted Fe-S protein YdhL (DUF1289 family)
MTDYSITWEDVLMTARFERANWEGYSPSEQAMVLEEATARVPETVYGTMTKIARRYFAAHLASMMDQVSAGQGTNATESIGSVSGSTTMPVNNPQATENLLSTIYGRQFYEVRRAKYGAFYAG